MQVVTPPGMQNPMSAAGDLIVGAAAGAPQRLALGPANQALTNVGGVVSWAPVNLDLAWPLAANVDETFEPSGVANLALTLHNPANAVDGLVISGAPTGPRVSSSGGVTVSTVGTDANIGLYLAPKGTGQVAVQTGGGADIVYFGTSTAPDTNGYAALFGAGSGYLGLGLNGDTTGSVALWLEGRVGAAVNNVVIVQGGAHTGGNAASIGSVSGANNDDLNVYAGSGNLNLYSQALTAASTVINGNAWSAHTVGQAGLTVTGTSTQSNNANGLTITQTPSGAAPSLAATGVDTNINLNLVSKGIGGVEMNSTLGGTLWFLPGDGTHAPIVGSSAFSQLVLVAQNGGPQYGQVPTLLVEGAANPVNHLIAANAATTAAPSLQATGSDTNVNLNLVTKGSGTVQVNGTPLSSNVTGGVLARTTYAPATSTTFSTTSSAYANVSTTNLSVTFTAPSSGKAELVFESAVNTQNATGGACMLGFASPTFASGAVQGFGQVGVAGTPWLGRVVFTAIVTGLSAGTSYTFYPQFANTANSEFDVLCGGSSTAITGYGTAIVTARAA